MVNPVKKIPTGTPLDKIIDGLEPGIITNIYGPAGSGKTNIIIASVLSMLRSGKKVVFIDTESNFSFERFSQLGGTDEMFKDIIFITPSSWDEQDRLVGRIFDKIKKQDIGLIVVDSMVALYRMEVADDNFRLINKQLAKQFSVLSNIARVLDIPVFVTSQVYSKREESGDISIQVTSNRIAKYWSKTMIELQRLQRSGYRLAILRRHRSKPENMKIEFSIEQDRLKEIGKFSLF
ncbi:DNA repair and recombination protein RadB [archaeon]|nr:DNA repair and recombination protein RadB [archaeon]|tara:strand:+ start:522 stop:1226 length:705 start_codon:yes stop_codon:yes gene_type:complete